MEGEEKSRSVFKIILIIISTIIATIFFLILIAFAWIWVKNPFNVRAMILNYIGLEQSVEKTDVLIPTGSKDGPATVNTETGIHANTIQITPDQKKALESAGIDTGSIVITPEMESCFRKKLGNERVEEIIQGDTPGPIDMFKAASCL